MKRSWPYASNRGERIGRLATNLWLLTITLALGILLNLTLALGAAYFAESGIGLLQLLGVGGAAATESTATTLLSSSPSELSCGSPSED